MSASGLRMLPRKTATLRSSSQVVSSVGRASTRTLSPRSCSARVRLRPRKPFPPVISISILIAPSLVLRAHRATRCTIPGNALTNTVHEIHLRREAQLAARPANHEAILTGHLLQPQAHE